MHSLGLTPAMVAVKRRKSNGNREQKSEIPVADRGHVGRGGLVYLFGLIYGRRGRGGSGSGSQARSGDSEADRGSGMRRVSRRRRQQREPGESKYCRAARRGYYLAIDAFPKWKSPQRRE